MNEEQRLETNQIKNDPQANLDRLKKMDADELIGKYFQATYQPPNLKKAKKRLKKDVDIHYDYAIPEDMKGIGQGKKFLIRTYGCQMNEHDSEVMAGLLTDLGYQPTEETTEADVILLNTCAIRENAENRVFGEIGHLKPIKMENPDLIIGFAVVCLRKNL